MDTSTPGPKDWIKPEALRDRFLWVADIALVGNHLIVLDLVDEIVVFDVSDPTAPQELGATEIDEHSGTLDRPTLTAGGHVAIVHQPDWRTGGSMGWAIDLSNPVSPTVHPLSNDLGWTNWSSVGAIDMSGNTATAAVDRYTTYGWKHFVEEVDFSNPAAPILKASRELSRSASSIDCTQHHVIIGSFGQLHFHDRNDDLELVGASGVDGSADRITAADGLGLMTNGTGGIVSYDLSDPEKPVEIARFNDGVRYGNIYLDGTTAIASSTATDTVATIDASDPSALEVLDSLVIDGLSWELETSGTIAGVHSSYSDLGGPVHIIDWSDPHNLILRSSFNPVDSPYYSPIELLRLNGSHLFVLASQYGPFISVDVSNPDDPVVLDSIDEVHGYSFDILEAKAFIGERNRIGVVSVADPGELAVDQYLEGVSATLVERIGTQNLAVAGGSLQGLADFTDLDHPIIYGEPTISRWYDTGIIIGNTWLRPSGHVIDVVSLECRPPEAEIRSSGRGPTIWFEDLSRYQVTERTWDFGDGETSSNLNPVHTYASPGDYTVTLTVSSPNGTDTATRTIEVGPTHVRFQPPGSRRP